MRLHWLLAIVVSLPVMGGAGGYLALIGPAPLRFEQAAPPWVLTALPHLDMGDKPDPAEAEPKHHADSKTNSAATTPTAPAAQPPAAGTADAAALALLGALTNGPTAWSGTNAPALTQPGPPGTLPQQVLPGPSTPLLVPQMLLPLFQSGVAPTNRFGGALLSLPFIPPSSGETKSSTVSYEKK